MKKILVIGGGAMGSAFTFPCLENKNDVTITEPYSKRFIYVRNIYLSHLKLIFILYFQFIFDYIYLAYL